MCEPQGAHAELQEVVSLPTHGCLQSEMQAVEVDHFGDLDAPHDERLDIVEGNFEAGTADVLMSPD